MTRWVPAASPGAALFFALLAATLVVATLVVRARTPDLVLEVIEVTPRELTVDEVDEVDGVDEVDEMRIAFFVREADSEAEVSIVDADEQVVRTLAAPVALAADREVTHRWDGRDDAGRLVRQGRYRLRVLLPNRDRDMIWPRRISLRREPGGGDGP